jgi:hypothetical protein
MVVNIWRIETLLGKRGVRILLMYYRQEWCSVVQAWNLATKRDQRDTDRARRPLCTDEESESHPIRSIVEVHRKAEVNTGDPEQQTIAYQRRNSTQDDTHCRNSQ